MDIVYTSLTGFTKRYAELLSSELGIECLSLDEAKASKKGGTVVYLGWISAGQIKGLTKARKLFDVKAVAGVGLGAPSDKVLANLVRQNNLSNLPAFYLQGGLDMNKLKGMNKFGMKIMYIILSIKNKKSGNADTEKALAAYKDGLDCVSAENLKDFAAVCKTL